MGPPTKSYLVGVALILILAYICLYYIYIYYICDVDGELPKIIYIYIYIVQ